jgi:2-methylcitrate dehydratase PrpD
MVMEGAMEVTEAVARFVARLTWADLPEEVVKIAVDHLLDTFGVMLAGSREAVTRLLRSAIGEQAGNAVVLGFGRRQSPLLAALINGTAGHALDYDDTQLATSEEAVYGLLTHPSTPVLAAAIGMAGRVPASGQDLVTAYVAGVEVACRVADAIHARHYQDGFHSTGTVGTIGAAVAAGKMLGLTEEGIRVAIGIAASLAGGLRENFGTMTKPLHAGRAAQSGVLAAILASNGFTASEHGLEAPRGFFRAAGGGFVPDRILGRLGQPFYLVAPGVSIKPYPSGSLSHPAQDLVLEMAAREGLSPQSIELVEVGTNSNVPNALIHHRPRTGLEAKFSMEYCVATGFVRGRAGLAEFTDEAVADPEIQAFLPKVQLVVDPELERLGFRHVRTRVRVHCSDGRCLEREAEWARGYPQNPLPPAALEAKFLECARTCLTEEQAIHALESIRSLADHREVSEVLATLETDEEAR